MKEWRWAVAVLVGIVAFVTAGLVVTSGITRNESSAAENRTALVTVCATLGTLQIVFEQLQLVDAELVGDRGVPRALRRHLKTRANLYGTAVDSLSRVDANCDLIE